METEFCLVFADAKAPCCSLDLARFKVVPCYMSSSKGLEEGLSRRDSLAHWRRLCHSWATHESQVSSFRGPGDPNTRVPCCFLHGSVIVARRSNLLLLLETWPV